VKLFPLEILTPEKQFFSDEVEALTITSVDGELTILADHMPISAPLVVGKIRIKRKDGTWKDAFQSEGFLEVGADGRTHVFVQACEWPENIDAVRAAKAAHRIEERMRQQHSMVEYQWSKIALARAMTRLRITNKNVNID